MGKYGQAAVMAVELIQSNQAFLPSGCLAESNN